jgi:hypothetical protein
LLIGVTSNPVNLVFGEAKILLGNMEASLRLVACTEPIRIDHFIRPNYDIRQMGWK